MDVFTTSAAVKIVFKIQFPIAVFGITEGLSLNKKKWPKLGGPHKSENLVFQKKKERGRDPRRNENPIFYACRQKFTEFYRVSSDGVLSIVTEFEREIFAFFFLRIFRSKVDRVSTRPGPSIVFCFHPWCVEIAELFPSADVGPMKKPCRVFPKQQHQQQQHQQQQ